MSMRRKIYDALLEWKKGDGESAMLIEGARRVGKTFVAEEFGRNEYRSFIVVDFRDEDVVRAFEEYGADLDLLFSTLSLIYGTRLYRGESLIVLDDVHRYIRARQLIKDLVKDRRYDYIETGSLVSIRTRSSDIVIPSEEDRLVLRPMDFEEFLWALGEGPALETMRGCFERRVPVGDATHKRMMHLFKQYVLVGGMPQAVSEYAESRNLERTDLVKREILGICRKDIGDWAGNDADRVRDIFDRIPEELDRKDKVFTLSTIGRNARMREYERSFMWLADCHVANLCMNSNSPDIGLSVFADRPALKCYMADTGLLVTHACAEGGYADNELYRSILLDGVGVNEGMLLENVVAQTLASKGDRPFFLSRGRNDPDGPMRVDFLVRRRGRICPVVVKPGNRIRDHRSLDNFLKKYGKRLGQAYVVHTKDLSVEDGIVYLPAYMTMLI